MVRLIGMALATVRRGRGQHGAAGTEPAVRRTRATGAGGPAGRAEPARPAGRAARRGRPVHLGERRRRHRRRPVRGARHPVRRPDDHRRRAGQGPRRGPRWPASCSASYRHVAYERADLRAIVADLDRAVARSVGDEDFVTAALVEERGGTLTDRQLRPPGAAAAAPRRGDPARAAAARAAARLHAGRAAAGRAAGAGRPAPALHRRAGRGPPGRASSSRPPSGPGGCSATAPSSDGLASLESALIEWVAGGSTTTSRCVLMEYAGAAPGRSRPYPAGRSAAPVPARF